MYDQITWDKIGINQIHPTIKLTHDISDIELTFLDVSTSLYPNPVNSLKLLSISRSGFSTLIEYNVHETSLLYSTLALGGSVLGTVSGINVN